MTHESSKYLLVVGGPTASGKTSLAIQLAQHFSTVILSADSRQFYQEMQIGNARPTTEELSSVPHYFVADRSVNEPLSAGAFAREGQALLKTLFQEHDHVVLVGGSGLFVRALTEGLDEFPAISASIRMKVDNLFATGGLAALQQELKTADPDYFKEVDQQNPARLRRALEVCYETGKPYSSFRQAGKQPRSFVPLYLQPDWPRQELYDRINRRVQIMLSEGLEDEARSLEQFREMAAMQTVGYQEWWPFFAGEQSKERTVELIQQNSRRYAKRQLTWNRRDGYWKLVPKGDLRAALSYVHLVKEEQLTLCTFAVEDLSIIIHGREEKKRLGLMKLQEQKISAVADLAFWKDLVFCRFWMDAELGHNGASVLLHEACHRSEAETVYTAVKSDRYPTLLKSNGWSRLQPDDKISPLLQEQFSDNQIWVWNRLEQAF